MMPNLSLVGHLAGIIVGYLEMTGTLDPLLINDAYLREIESSMSNMSSSPQRRQSGAMMMKMFQWIKKQPNFIPTPNTSVSYYHNIQTSSSSFDSSSSTVVRAIRFVAKFLHDLSETICVCLFGRGRVSNANVRLFSNATAAHLGSFWRSRFSRSSNSSGTTAATGDVGMADFIEGVEEDDDWVGLPPMPAPDVGNSTPTVSRIV